MISYFDIGQLYAYKHEVGVNETQSVRALTIEILIAIFGPSKAKGRTLNSQGQILRAHTNEKSMLVTAPLTQDIETELGGWYKLI